MSQLHDRTRKQFARGKTVFEHWTLPTVHGKENDIALNEELEDRARNTLGLDSTKTLARIQIPHLSVTHQDECYFDPSSVTCGHNTVLIHRQLVDCGFMMCQWLHRGEQFVANLLFIRTEDENQNRTIFRPNHNPVLIYNTHGSDRRGRNRLDLVLDGFNSYEHESNT